MKRTLQKQSYLSKLVQLIHYSEAVYDGDASAETKPAVVILDLALDAIDGELIICDDTYI